MTFAPPILAAGIEVIAVIAFIVIGAIISSLGKKDADQQKTRYELPKDPRAAQQREQSRRKAVAKQARKKGRAAAAQVAAARQENVEGPTAAQMQRLAQIATASRDPVSPTRGGPPKLPGQRSPADDARLMLRSGRGLSEAFVLSQILGKPKSLEE